MYTTRHESRIIARASLMLELLLQLSELLNLLLLLILAHWLVLLWPDRLLWARRTWIRWWDDLWAVLHDEIVKAERVLLLY